MNDYKSGYIYTFTNIDGITKQLEVFKDGSAMVTSSEGGMAFLMILRMHGKLRWMHL